MAQALRRAEIPVTPRKYSVVRPVDAEEAADDGGELVFAQLVLRGSLLVRSKLVRILSLDHDVLLARRGASIGACSEIGRPSAAVDAHTID
jgi:hypothetical protein